MRDTTMVKIKSRRTGEVLYQTSAEAPRGTPASQKLGRAVMEALDEGYNLSGTHLSGVDLSGAYLFYSDFSDCNFSGADLRNCNLRGAYLRGAYFKGCNFTGADLTGANLVGCNLSGTKGLTDEQLRPVIADLWMVLSMAREEVPALIDALRAGRVDGKVYEGECACLVGTLKNAGASELPYTINSPAELWFATIRKGDKPGDDSPGGAASARALEWTLDYCARTGIDVEPVR